MSLLLLAFGKGEVTLDLDRQYLMQFFESAAANSSAHNLSASPCQWPGVSCSPAQGRQLRVVALNLTSSGLHGTIAPGTLGRLDALLYLNLFNNSLQGSVPPDLWQLPSISYLNLSCNALSGTLTIQYLNSSSLQVIDLSRNSFSGVISPSLGLFTGLQALNLSNNRFENFIPPELFSCIHLRAIDLSSNRLTGAIPAGLERLTRIKTINLANNSINGQIPVAIFRFPFLSALDLSSNRFTGSIPQPNPLRRLRAFDVSGNQLSGSLPPRLFTLQLLESVSVRQNKLTGQLPPPSNSSRLMILDVESNGLNGPVPQGWWTLPSLAILRLSNNLFSGNLTPVLGATISELDLRNNLFEGDIASALRSWPRGLTFLELSSNKLTGNFPHPLTNFSSLLHLGVAANSISIASFPTISQLPKLCYLNLSRTHLLSVIPTEIGALRSLMQLDLSHNFVYGIIPLSIANMTQLLYLDLSFNNLTGSIPSGLGSLTSLKYLNLSYNNLSGRIPSSITPDLIGASAFLGNPQLCGALLHQNCPPQLPVQTVTTKHGRSISSRERILIIVGAVVGFLMVGCCLVTIFACWRRVKRNKTPPYKQERYVSSSGPFSSEIDPTLWAAGIKDPSSIPVVMFEKPLMSFSFADLLQATSTFNKENQIADGAYGAVFTGTLPGGLRIAIKILVEVAPATEQVLIPKLEALGRLKHSNLVPLLGYCLIGIEKLLLYASMENGDLHHCLHDLPEGVQNTEDWSSDTWENIEGEETRDVLSWRIRHKIAVGTARALAFLHHGCSPHIVHQDVTASNILLDAEYEPHLADTGLADLLTAKNENPPIQSFSGYTPPEYLHTKEPSTKGDVYSFGVLLLEIVTGKRPTGDYLEEGNYSGNLVSWVRALLKEKKGIKALDPKLLNRGPVVQILETLRIGYLCTADAPGKRPTMQQVVGLLKDLQPNQSTSSKSS
ncbi:hypothetical protein O6H91_Y358900 [Diphasiastrum complanatum]|nr:hypothetical protein O6H91_Y358900 [Diphasiastrum complanatum]